MPRTTRTPPTDPLVQGAARLERQLELGIRRHERARDRAIGDDLLPELAGPIPATRVVRFDPLAEARVIPPATDLDPVESDDADPVRWRTGPAVYPGPLDVAAVTLADGVASIPASLRPDAAQAALWITVRSDLEIDDRPLAEWADFDGFTLYLDGPLSASLPLYQALTRDRLAAFARTPEGALVPIRCRAVGFEPEDELVPSPAVLPAGSRLVTELFVAPSKFLFLEFAGLADVVRGTDAAAFELVLVLRRADDLPRLRPDLFLTRCTVAVNLFTRELPLLELDPTRVEWPIDAGRGVALHAIDRVEGFDPQERRWDDLAGRLAFRRRKAGRRPVLVVSDVLFRPESPPTRFVRITATCGNGAAAAAEPEGREVQTLNSETARLLAAGSHPIVPASGSLSRWFTSGHAEPFTNLAFARLLRQHALLDGQVADADRAAEVARRKRVRRALSGLAVTEVRRAELDLAGGIAHGREVELEVQPDRFPHGAFWASVSAIEAFLALNTPLGEFTRVVVRTVPQGEVFRCPARFGLRASL